ncbi:cytochrome c [Filimonas lacunae]|uniref:Cytochrome c n=1 Tax=Filimonas lacunae TaxID=477680 RepID=A0A173MG15_9BACT|nr:c-type cytochrome [Filimonas lacunae]BAV06368.1 cytochrome c551/c552 [Filimonas lacunae]SIT26653.1 cytochrome c [Filimonas lacunae]
MKKYSCYILALLLFFVACNSGNSGATGSHNATESLINTAANIVPEEFRNGARLITANDCFTCHAVDSVVKGPAFKIIAQKYQHLDGVVSNLSRSIISGSKGIWGDEQMTAHPNLSNADAREMILYIFSLDSTHTYDTTGTRGSLKKQP